MVGNKRARRWSRVAFAAGVLAVSAAVPAAATPDDGTGHTIEICHVTNSEAKPYILITVDLAAFDGEDNNDHTHHVAKDGRRDYILGSGAVCGSVDED